jgi:hypothetical protein
MIKTKQSEKQKKSGNGREAHGLIDPESRSWSVVRLHQREMLRKPSGNHKG